MRSSSYKDRLDDANLPIQETTEPQLTLSTPRGLRRFESFHYANAGTTDSNGSDPLLTLAKAKDIADRAVDFNKASLTNLRRGLNLIEEGLLQDDPESLSDDQFIEYAHAAAELASAAQQLRNLGYGNTGQALDFRLAESWCMDLLRDIEDKAKKMPEDQGFKSGLQACYKVLFDFVSASSAPSYHAEFWLDIIKSDSYLTAEPNIKSGALKNLLQSGDIPLFHAALDILISPPKVTKVACSGIVRDLICGGAQAIDLASAVHAMEPSGAKRLRQALRNNLAPNSSSSNATIIREVSSEALRLLIPCTMQ